MHSFDVAHVLGTVGKWLIIVAVFGLSITLSYMFFVAIAPVDKPWFPIAGMSLTEGGFLGWMFVFRMIKYHPVHKTIAMLMAIACAICSLSVAGFEFYGLLAAHFDLLTNPLVAQYVAYLLEAIFLAHFVSLIAELLIGEHEKNPFIQRGQRNLIPQYSPQNYYQQGYLPPANGGETATPLALHQGQPKEERNLEKTGEIKPPRQLKQLPAMQNHEGSILSEGVSLLTQKLRSSITSGRTADRARGKTSQTTSENM